MEGRKILLFTYPEIKFIYTIDMPKEMKEG